MGHRTLIHGGHVLTVDPQLGDLPNADVLIEDDMIVAVEPSISADAEVIEADRLHRHARLRRHPPAHLGGRDPRLRAQRHARRLLRRGARHLRARSTGPRTSTPPTWPARWSASTRASPRSSTGRTSTTPPSTRTRRSAALQETGIRAQYAYGSANTSLADYWFESKIAIPGDDVRRIRNTYFSSATVCSRWRWPPAVRASARTRWCARSGRWPASSTSRSPCTSRWAVWPAGSRWSSSSATWACSARTPPTSTAATSARRSGSWSPTAAARSRSPPQVETQMGHGWPPVMKAIEYGLRPELVHRRGHHGARRHVHPDPRRRSAPSGPGSTRSPGRPTSRSPDTMLTARADARDRHDQRRARGRAGGSHRLADPGQAGRRRAHRRAARSTWRRSTTRSPRSRCAPTCPTWTPCWSTAWSASATASCSADVDRRARPGRGVPRLPASTHGQAGGRRGGQAG